MIKAIIFDCFGVLATDGWLPFKRQYFINDNVKNERATELNHLVDAGLISYQDFVSEIAAMASVEPIVVDRALKSAVADERVFNYIRTDLKPIYKIGLLSNVSDDWLWQLFTPEDISVFDKKALSYEIGFIKPAPEAYQIIAERLGVEPNDCVFIDDQERNVTAANEQGMHGVWYRSFDQFKKDMQAII